MTKFKIRQYQPQDKESVVQLWHECQLVVPSNNPFRDIERKCAFQPHLFFVGELDGNIVASAMGGYEGHRGWINYLAVRPTHRKKGFGRLMVEHVENELRKTGCPKINIQVRKSNTGILEFFGKLGFKTDDVVGLGKRLVNDAQA